MRPLNTLDREAWFEGPSAACEVTLAVKLGDPGGGKGTPISGCCAPFVGNLFQREDDRPAPIECGWRPAIETLRRRSFFRKIRGLLIRVDATGFPDEIFQITPHRPGIAASPATGWRMRPSRGISPISG